MSTNRTRNEKLVLKFFKTLSSGDLEAVRKLLHADATWTVTAASIPGAGVHAGRDYIIDEFLAPIRGLFVAGDPKVEVDNIFSKGDQVAVQSRGIGKLRNGKAYRNYYAWIFQVRSGKVYAINEYMDSHHVITLLAD